MSKTDSNSKKFAAARNFFAVDLSSIKRRASYSKRSPRKRLGKETWHSAYLDAIPARSSLSARVKTLLANSLTYTAPTSSETTAVVFLKSFFIF